MSNVIHLNIADIDHFPSGRVSAAKMSMNTGPLHGGGGGGTFDGMSEVDAKIEAAEARTDTKFEKLLGELKLINQRMDSIERSTSGTKTTIIVTAIAALGLTVAIMAFGSQWFGLGMDAQQVSERAAQSALDKNKPQIDSLNGKLDQLIQSTRPRPNNSSP